MEINVHLGGRPGINCGGFCEFCFYRNTDLSKLNSLKLGCAYCPPDQIGCDYCRNSVTRIENKFKPLQQVITEFGNNLMLLNLSKKLNYDNLRITISGGADAFYYPQLTELVKILNKAGTAIHLGYVSGKGIKNIKQAQDLVDLKIDEVSFSIFSTNPNLRKKWMHDENPHKPIESLKMFCENCIVNASAVVIPGVNDEEQIIKTGEDLEKWGAETFILRLFANYKYQGLILNGDKPLIKEIKPFTYEEFQELVGRVSREFSFKVYGLPYYDPDNDSPFAIIKNRNKKYLEKLPLIKSEATIITGKLAFPYLKKIFNIIDKSGKINVISVRKEIADLITWEDLMEIDTDELKTNIIIPAGALVHNLQVLNMFGQDKNIKRGPYVLTNHSLQVDKETFLLNEYNSLKELIDIINLD